MTTRASPCVLVARYLEATAFIAAAILLNRKTLISPWALLGFSILIGGLALTLIWPFGIFPVCYIEGVGLTPFKIISEHIISTLLGFAILLFWRNRDRLDARVLKLLTYSILFSILTELAFTLYTDIYGVTNFIGHFAKFMSVVLLYRVLDIGTLRSPYATLFRDLSQAKETLDIELIQRRKIEADLRIANRELDAFVRTVSHDLRTPLTPIIGLPELLLDNLKDQIDETTKKSRQDIRSQGLRMARILEDLLGFARAGHLIDGITPAKVEHVVQNVLEDLGSKIVASGIVIEMKELPDIALPRTALFQIFANLVDNAIKYAGKEGGPIEIGGELNDNSVILSVCDHGPGIQVDIREKIFDVFYRGPEQQETPGTGVGLATVHKIAQCMGGNAWVEETEGGGSTFRVSTKPFGRTGRRAGRVRPAKRRRRSRRQKLLCIKGGVFMSLKHFRPVLIKVKNSIRFHGHVVNLHQHRHGGLRARQRHGTIPQGRVLRAAHHEVLGVEGIEVLDGGFSSAGPFDADVGFEDDQFLEGALGQMNRHRDYDCT